jgi:hypothetical protein
MGCSRVATVDVKSGRPRKRDRGWRLECLAAPRALAARTRKAINREIVTNRSVLCLVFLSGFSSGRLIFFRLTRLPLFEPMLHQLNF